MQFVYFGTIWTTKYFSHASCVNIIASKSHAPPVPSPPTFIVVHINLVQQFVTLDLNHLHEFLLHVWIWDVLQISFVGESICNGVVQGSTEKNWAQVPHVPKTSQV